MSSAVPPLTTVAATIGGVLHGGYGSLAMKVAAMAKIQPHLVQPLYVLARRRC